MWSADALAAVLMLYFPLEHNNRPASQNGVVTPIGEANGITTYQLVEPQSPDLTGMKDKSLKIQEALVTQYPLYLL